MTHAEKISHRCPLGWIFICVGAWMIPSYSAAQSALAGPSKPSGRLRCSVTENGRPATGSFVARQNGTVVEQGSCSAANLAVGDYTVEVQLDGAVDQPRKSFPISITKGGSESVTADFQTATLEVVIEVDGRRRSGLAKLY